MDKIGLGLVAAFVENKLLIFVGQDARTKEPGYLVGKGCEFKSRQERLVSQLVGARENFLLQSLLCVLTLIRCPFHPRVTAVARKRPWSF